MPFKKIFLKMTKTTKEIKARNHKKQKNIYKWSARFEKCKEDLFKNLSIFLCYTLYLDDFFILTLSVACTF